MASNQYISQQVFDWLLADLDILECDELKKRDILDRATGDLEADLSEKFVVPLVNQTGGAYSTCQTFAKNKILNALKAKIREIIGIDKNRNLVIDSTERFINTHGMEYKAQIKTLLDYKIDYGFKLLYQAENARNPIQYLGLARANNKVDPIEEDGIDP